MTGERLSVELHQVPLFAGISRAQIGSVLDACKMQTFLVGDEIFAEGDAGRALWIIEAGNVEVYKTIRGNVDRVLATFAPGSVFGEMSFLDGSRRSASARATEPTNVLMLEREAFDRVAEEHPRVAATFFGGLATVMAQRLRMTNEAYKQSVAAYMEVTGAAALTIHRLVEDLRFVTIHLSGGSAVKGTLLELHHQPQGWSLVIKDEEGTISLVPYQAVARIEISA
jgi:CRP/FNR family cyclic AMP-dependent transcriptional regulator